MHGTITSTRKRAGGKAKSASASKVRSWRTGALAGAALLGGAALFNHLRARRAEEANPPLGEFLTVDGVRLHYVEKGEGAPILLLHGNGSMVEDWIVSGLFDRLAETNRVIAFDRPGFGHSERPRTRIWTPAAQAALLAEALRALRAEQPLVVGHSFGTQVAIAMALDEPDSVSGLVLLGGYFYPSVRADVPLASPPAIPVVGDVMRYTISPLLGAATLPLVQAKIFEPAEVPARWTEEFPLAMTLRPSQIRSEAAEAALMIPGAAALSARIGELTLPVTIVSGDGDRIVDMEGQSQRLSEALPQSRFVEVPGAGHMVHQTAPDTVFEAIRAAG
jgi:pimeloyl-ACP methyl ester carboxylesterase